MSKTTILYMSQRRSENKSEDERIRQRFSDTVFKQNAKNIKGLEYKYKPDEDFHKIVAIMDNGK